MDFDPDDRDYDSIRLDPISTFTFSETSEDEKEKEEASSCSMGFTVVSLKPNVDVEVHPVADEERRMKVIWAKKDGTDPDKGLSQDTVDGIRNYFQMLDCIDSQVLVMFHFVIEK